MEVVQRFVVVVAAAEVSRGLWQELAGDYGRGLWRQQRSARDCGRG